MANYIFGELLEEILVRVPIKSLLRFKSTCKSWRRLIESASFVEFHALRRCLDHQNRLIFSRYNHVESKCFMYSCAFHNSFNLITTWPLHYPLLHVFDDVHFPYTTILGPLSKTSSIYCIIDNDDRSPDRISVATSKVALFNPATRECKLSNPFPFEETFSHNPPMLSLVCYGFGSVLKAGTLLDYKVVVIVLTGHDYSDLTRFFSFVYSLKRGTWSKIVDDITYGASYDKLNGSKKAVAGLVNKRGEVETPRLIDHNVVKCAQLFFNGSWHWLDVVWLASKYADRVLLFDIANETFGVIRGPPHDYPIISNNHGYVRGGVALLNDHLAAIYLVHNNNNGLFHCSGIDVWMMMDYGVEESWTKIYSYEAAFGRKIWGVTGLFYSTTGVEDHNVNINKIFFEGNDTGQLVSFDGSHVKEHDFYLLSNDPVWNTLGISTYVETLNSLTLDR